MFPRRFFGDPPNSLLARNFGISLSELFSDRRFHFWLIAAMSALVFFSKLHIGDLGGYDDAVYAHEGKQMLVTGQWWSVCLNGQFDFDKPPMFVWLEAISMWVFGFTDFAARFPSALLGFGTILLVYFIACELSDSYRLPIWSMLVLLCTQEFVRFSMRAMTDAPFTFFFALTIFAYLKGLKRSGYFLLMGSALAAAILTRSILGIIPLAVVLAHLTLTRQTARLFSGSFVAGLAIAICLPMIWFVSQYRLHGAEFLAKHFSFTVENLPLTNGKNAEQFQSSLFQYPILLLQSYWPWLPLMILGLWSQIRKLFRETDSTAILLLVWVLAVIVPFSLVHYKWLRYILPVFPAFSILAALPICQWLEWKQKRAFPSLQLKAFYALLGLLMLAMAINPKYRDRPEELRRLAPFAEAATSPEHRILLYTERTPRDAHLYQLIWYANRNCELLDVSDEVFARLESQPKTAVIMDRESFNSSTSKIESGIQVLAETERFVCWTISNSTEQSGRNETTDSINFTPTQLSPSGSN